MKNSIVLFLVLCLNLSTQAQEYKLIQKGLYAESQGEFLKAAQNYYTASLADPTNEYLHYKVGKNLLKLGNYEDALVHYDIAKGAMKDSIQYHFDLYHLFSRMGNKNAAKQAFNRYVSLCPNCIKKDIEHTEIAESKSKKPIKEAQLMGYGAGIKAEYYPYIINDDKVQHLNQSMDKLKVSNPIKFNKYLTNQYTNADFMFFNVREFDQIDKLYGVHYGPFTLNKYLNQIYITRWDEKRGRMMIFHSKKTDNTKKDDVQWSPFYPIKVNIDNGISNMVHPMLTKDETQLIFASNLPGGLGGYDLWIGDIINDHEIMNVKNLGTYVNTPGDECFPTVYDDKTIFFASNGHFGYGNLDIYAAIKNINGFSRTYNIGNKFNSVDDDYALFYNEKKNLTFFTSNRYRLYTDSTRLDRIYKQTFDKLATTFYIKSESGQPIANAAISLPGENLAKMTEADGSIDVNLNPLGTKKIIVKSDKYEIKEAEVGPFEREVTVVMKKVLPKDQVNFLFASHPYGNTFGNLPYTLTNVADKTEVRGMSAEDGIASATIFGDDEYRIDVPTMKFSQTLKFNLAETKKFHVKNDLLPVVVEKPKSDNSTTNAAGVAAGENSDQFNIYYENNQWIIDAETESKIMTAVATMNKNPTYILELASHSDCQGDDKMNMELSKNRMNEAIKMFFLRGLSDTRIKGSYYGETKPANDCKCDNDTNHNCMQQDLRLNRRTEVKIVK